MSVSHRVLSKDFLSVVPRNVVVRAFRETTGSQRLIWDMFWKFLVASPTLSPAAKSSSIVLESCQPTPHCD